MITGLLVGVIAAALLLASSIRDSRDQSASTARKEKQ